MDLFDFDDFRKFTLSRFQAMPKRGHGQLKKLAEHLGVHTTFVSQVFQGEKTLSPEQGMGVAEFLGLNDLETRYFIKLIQIDKAGTDKLKKLLMAELLSLRDQSRRVSTRLTIDKVLPDEQKAIFYSSWHYSAIRLLIGIDGKLDAESIANYFQLPRKKVSEAINFLLENGLLVRDNKGLKVGPSKTYIEPESLFTRLHHQNWRQRAIFNLDRDEKANLHYSSPMSLGKKESALVRKRLAQLIVDVGEIINPAPNEELMCLNIDWFKVR